MNLISLELASIMRTLVGYAGGLSIESFDRTAAESLIQSCSETIQVLSAAQTFLLTFNAVDAASRKPVAPIIGQWLGQADGDYGFIQDSIDLLKKSSGDLSPRNADYLGRVQENMADARKLTKTFATLLKKYA